MSILRKQYTNGTFLSLIKTWTTIWSPFDFTFSSDTTNASPLEKDDMGYADGFDDESFEFGTTETKNEQKRRRISSPFGRPPGRDPEERPSPSKTSWEEPRSDFRPGKALQRAGADLLPVTIQPRGTDEELPRYHPSQEPYEGGFVSVDESPYRLREIFHLKELWRASMTHPGRPFDSLMEHLRPLALWQNIHAYLIGGKALQMVQANPRLRREYEQGIKDIRNAVISGEFMWRGKAGIFIQGEMRRGMEPRMYRSDVKDMEEYLAAQGQKEKPNPPNKERKEMLESYFQDRLVSEVLRVLLEPVFEPTFSDYSHGFRPGRTQHTALKQVRRDFSDAIWMYRSDLRGLFELVLENRRKFSAQLLRLIEKRVQDETVLELLFSGIQTRTIMSDYEINPPEEGYSPLNTKAGIVPLLCNIYFDPLDQWIEEKMREVNRGKYRRINPERAALILRGVDEKVANELLPLDPYDPIYRRLCYCRFADDFVFGFSGPKELAMELKEEFWEFAAAQLLFPLPDCDMKHVREKTRFLGHILRRRVIMPRKSMVEVRRMPKGRVSEEMDAEEIRVGSTTYQIPEPKPDSEEIALQSMYAQLSKPRKTISDGPREILSVDGETDKIVRLLARAGYSHKNGDPQPNFKHLHFAQSETNQVIRRMLLSICDMYRVARNRQRLVHYCSYILRHSIAKMYAAKFKLRSRAKVFKRGGAHLGERIQHGKGYIGKIDPDTGRSMEEYAELPYARLSEIPKPDLLPLPPNWKPEIIHILNEKLLGNIPRF